MQILEWSKIYINEMLITLHFFKHPKNCVSQDIKIFIFVKINERENFEVFETCHVSLDVYQRPAVNFINVKCANFSYKSLFKAKM